MSGLYKLELWALILAVAVAVLSCLPAGVFAMHSIEQLARAVGGTP